MHNRTLSGNYTTKNVAQAPSCDFNEAQRYLKMLDPEADEFTFLTFGEGDKKGDRSLTRGFNGSFEQHKQKLADLNQRGAGIYVTVNQTDLKGRRKENITAIRTVFIENDDGKIPPLPIEPSMEIESSPGKKHIYYLTHCEDVSEFNAVQQRMVNNYASDPSAKDVSRVLRVPGFYHQKHDPFQVRILKASGQRYSWEEITEAFPPATPKGQTNPVEAENFIEGGRNTQLASIAGSLRQLDRPYEEIKRTLTAYNLSKCYPPLDESEVVLRFIE